MVHGTRGASHGRQGEIGSPDHGRLCVAPTSWVKNASCSARPSTARTASGAGHANSSSSPPESSFADRVAGCGRMSYQSAPPSSTATHNLRVGHATAASNPAAESSRRSITTRLPATPRVRVKGDLTACIVDRDTPTARRTGHGHFRCLGGVASRMSRALGRSRVKRQRPPDRLQRTALTRAGASSGVRVRFVHCRLMPQLSSVQCVGGGVGGALTFDPRSPQRATHARGDSA